MLRGAIARSVSASAHVFVGRMNPCQLVAMLGGLCSPRQSDTAFLLSTYPAGQAPAIRIIPSTPRIGTHLKRVETNREGTAPPPPPLVSAQHTGKLQTGSAKRKQKACAKVTAKKTKSTTRPSSPPVQVLVQARDMSINRPRRRWLPTDGKQRARRTSRLAAARRPAALRCSHRRHLRRRSWRTKKNHRTSGAAYLQISATRMEAQAQKAPSLSVRMRYERTHARSPAPSVPLTALLRLEARRGRNPRGGAL